MAFRKSLRRSFASSRAYVLTVSSAAKSLPRLAHHSWKPHRDGPSSKAGRGVDEIWRAITSWSAERVTIKAGPNIGEIEWAVVVGKITVRIALGCRSATHSNAEES